MSSQWGTICYPLKILCFLLMGRVVSCFNLDNSKPIVFQDPSSRQGGRSSYFGFSVALQSNKQDFSSWLLVGAPRANSSHYNSFWIREPGVIYKCSLNDRATCKELVVDRTGNSLRLNDYYQDLKNHGWLGAALDSQPTYKDGRQATSVCAPRWRNNILTNQYLMQGVCYWMNASLSDARAHKIMPILDPKNQVLRVDGRNFFHYSHGQAGMSVHFPDNNKEMIIGAPGIFNWQGTVINLKDPSANIYSFHNRRRMGAITEEKMFSSEFVPNPLYTSEISDFDLNGYSVTSGKFFSKHEIMYVSGAPRGANMHGKVLIFSFPRRSYSSLSVRAQWKGSQLGENFGASVVAADLNGDGFSDLVVGSPTYSTKDKPDMGRIQVFISSQVGSISKVSSHSGSMDADARFGTSLAALGDLNLDLYEDIAVGAPWEDDGNGAVYIYLGSRFGLRAHFTQRLIAEQISRVLNLGKGFGMSLSRGIDIDNNNYPDLAVGSFLSSHALVYKAQAVVDIIGYLTAIPSALVLTDTSFRLNSCLHYEGKYVPEKINVLCSILLDNGNPSGRAVFVTNNLSQKNYTLKIEKDKVACISSNINVNPQGNRNTRQPILVTFKWEIQKVEGQYQPVVDPAASNSSSLPIRIKTDCEDDGDQICSIDLHVTAQFINYKRDDPIIIGSNDRPLLEVSVMNLGESVFLPNISIQVAEPFAIFKPSTHDCTFGDDEHMRSLLVCQLISPLQNDHEDIIQVIIDTSKVTDTANEFKVDVIAAGEGTEVEPQDNYLSLEIKLQAKADLELRGYSSSDKFMYQRIDEDTVDTTIDIYSFTHYYTVTKSGPTPLERIDFEVDIPVNLTNDIKFVTIYTPKANFLNQPYQCTIQGSTFAIDKPKNEGIEDDLNPEDTLPPSSREVENGIKKTSDSRNRQENTFTRRLGITAENESPDLIHSKTTPSLLSCNSTFLTCARIQCQINSWPKNTQSADFSVRLEVDMEILARYISARAGTIVSTTAKASIISLNKDLDFPGKSNDSVKIEVDFLPLKLNKRWLPWWIILLAILAGLLLLMTLAFALYKIGFFKRKEQEEMKSQRAEVHSQNNYGATEGDD